MIDSSILSRRIIRPFTRLFIRPLRRLKGRRSLRPFLLMAITVFIITQIVALNPSQLEENAPSTSVVDPEALMPEPASAEGMLATGIPTGRIPDYSVDRFNYVSSRGTEKQWRLVAEEAFLYNKENIVHATSIEANLYDPEGKITVVTGKEAKYFMNKRDLEVFGNVKTVFPDGFELHSEYLRYRPQERRIDIPTKYAVQGKGKENGGQAFEFTSLGMDFAMSESKIVLPENVVFMMAKAPGTYADHTKIESDHCLINRNRQIAHFTMNPAKPLDRRFVYITKPTLLTRGRRADLNYGDLSKLLQYLVVHDDVLVKETAADGKRPESLRYATSGKAAFDTKRNVIVMSDFPQVYQDNDTVTGEVIIVHRDSDIVEVEKSNAFSQGDKVN